MAATKGKKQSIVTVRINLVGYRPEIWRTFQVPSAISLPSLHDVIQVVMGWCDCHLHEFATEQHQFADPLSDNTGENQTLDSRTVSLSHFMFDPGDEIHYEYDFGDGWRHRLVATAFDQGTLSHARCLAGERQCPPEDVGGVPGFRSFLAAIEDPKHEEHESQLAWCDGAFDPNEFSTEGVNAALKCHKVSTRLVKARRPSLAMF